jgi:tripartite-type tricarboxylate transporter receptor subunit TctC
MKKTALSKVIKGILIISCLITGLVGLAHGADEKFPGKTITFIVPTTPGGGFDTNARIIAPFLRKYLPGKPNVIVKNIPGASFQIGTMQMLKSKPDGNTLCIFSIPGDIVGQIAGLLQHDLTKVSWVGTITSTFMVMAVSPKSQIRTLDDLRKYPNLKSGVVGLGSSASLATLISAHEMGFKVKFVNYDGSTEALLSAIRNDTQVVTYNFPSIKRFIVDSKDLVPFVVFAKERLTDLPETPTIGELGYEKLLKVVGLDNMLGVHPDTPPNIIKVWRTAFDKAVADSEFKAMLKKQLKHDPAPLNGDQTANKINAYLETYGKYKSLITPYLVK